LPGFSEVAHWSMLLAAILSGKKRAVVCDATLRDRSQSWFKGVFKRLFFLLCHGYFTYGQRGKEYLKHYGARPDRIFQRVQAAALPAGYAAENALQTRIAALRFERAPLFLYVGRLSPEKSIDVLLEAFAAVRKALPDSQLRIVGAGPQKDDLVRLRDELGLAECVTFVGSMDLAALSAEYLSAHCFVLPSQSEPWGLVVNEALHYGCPVVVSDNCGCVPELIIDGVTGYRFRAGNAQEMADRMVQGVTAFADSETTANNCLKAIADFNPETSARQTLRGCKLLMSECA
jgi:glycosyltransferase involved in cell wall biosynthesis